MQNIEQERHSWLKLSLLLIWLFLLFSLSAISSGNDISINPDNKMLLGFMYLFQVISVIFVFIVPALLISILWTSSKIHYTGITNKPSMITLLLAGIGILMAMPLINWLSDLNQHMQLPEALNGIETWMKHSEAKAAEMTEIFTSGTSITKLILNLFVMAFMAALSEEMFFRGILQKVLIECTRNKHVGVWIGAAIFSAFHMQFYGFLPRMLMGGYLGYMFLWTGSLWPGILAHFLNNGATVFILWLSNRGAISADVDKIGTEGNQWIYVLTSVVMVVTSMIFVYRMEQKKTKVAIEIPN